MVDGRPTDGADVLAGVMVSPENTAAAGINRSSVVSTPSRNSQQSNPHNNASSSNASSVQVAVRVRPILASEGGSDTCLEMFPQSLRIGGPSGPRFSFDRVFAPSTQQAEVFDFAVPLLEATLEGYNATILAYGQTGSGKTHTVMGHSLEEEPGVIPRAVQRLFDSLDAKHHPIVQVQFLEIYGEEIRDLLRPATTTSALLMGSGSSPQKKLSVREQQGEPIVVGATTQEIQTAVQALRILQQGLLRRVTGATAMNTTSSRSHAMFSLHVSQTLPADDPDLPPVQRRSKFHFVDLAGSERQKRTQATGQRLREGIDINKGLLVLGNVISALSENKPFVPYRDSKLTRLLQGSLGGNHKTLMIACVSPSSLNLEESLNCLRYANRAKNIQNVAVVNVDPTTQKLQALVARVQSLAHELLRSVRNPDYTVAIPTPELEALVGGDEDALRQTAAAYPVQSPVSLLGSPPRPGMLSDDDDDDASADRFHGGGSDAPTLLRRRLHEAQIELHKTQRQLRQVQQHHETAEEQLYVTKAAKQLVDLQLSVATDHHPGSSSSNSNALSQAFVAQATEYERRIGEMQARLDQQTALSSTTNIADTEIDEHILRKAQEGLDRDRARLVALQSSPHDELGTLLGSSNDPQQEPATPISTATLDREEEAEQRELENLTDKYLDPSESSEHGGPRTAGPLVNGALQADLIELSRSIAAKEDLIDQLKLSQEKYASMQDFYESKLEQMKTALGEKESEREDLLRQLSNAKKGDPNSKVLGERLREKEAHIATLKRRQKELIDLTTVSSRNDTEIGRLLSDVKDMKRRKVDLQKQLGSERKNHANELKRLRKDALQKDRELNKQRKVSNQREAEAQRANQVAKARLEELSQVRAKYKDAEKRFRLLSVKRGVMAKAGLDPVLVGRRTPATNNNNANNKSSRTEATPVGHRTRSRAKAAVVDADALRDYFDKKVTDVARKEALVDKLAQEWEEHYELATKREAIDAEDVDSREQQQALDVQVQFKENRIRQLAQRLGKNAADEEPGEAASETDPQNDKFLFDREFARIRAGASAQNATGAASRVLFGMVVRERRRIANLARTASSLDERLQDAEKRAMESEAALRSYMDEQRHELAAMTQSQQEHILSLMDMVRQDSLSDSDGPNSSRQEAPLSDTLEVLANERIQVLENQLAALQTEADTVSSYRNQIDELKAAAVGSTTEIEDLQDELSGLRSALRQVREVAESTHDDGFVLEEEILEIVKSVLHPVHPKTPSGRPKRPTSRSGKNRAFLSPRLKKHVEIMHTSDSADDLEDANTPDWTKDIMADLALIADGKIPPSLVGSPGVPEEVASGDPSSSSVFDRLADPGTFTGVQKQVVTTKSRSDTGAKVRSPNDKKQRREMSKQIADQLERIVIPDGKPPASSDAAMTPKSTLTVSSENTEATESKGYKSVFERLVSPSQYTGTQKEKFHKSKEKRSKAAEEVADRMLDDLLGSDSDRPQGESSESNATRSLANDYTQQDVFERLQRTTTQSYAVKHNGTMLPEYGDFSVPANSKANSVSDANNSERGATNHDDSISSDTAPQSQYTSQNVFERLQKTSTEAYKAKREI